MILLRIVGSGKPGGNSYIWVNWILGTLIWMLIWIWMRKRDDGYPWKYSTIIGWRLGEIVIGRCYRLQNWILEYFVGSIVWIGIQVFAVFVAFKIHG